MNYKTGKYGKKACLHCSTETTNAKFCSNRCQQDYSWDLRKEEITRTGKIPERRVGIRYLKEVRGNKCEICGIEDWNDKSLTLIMDHINGNSDVNELINLRLICPNCDSQLPTYKNRNRGNGRHIRRQRYAKNKSF